VAGDEPLWRDGPRYRPAQALATELSPLAWQRRSAGHGAKGLRYYDWAWQLLWRLQLTTEEQAWGHWLVVRQRIDDPREHAYYVAFAPRKGTTLDTLVQVAGRRWSIEVGFEAAKQECGLDEYEVLTWDAWHRHITLMLLAHAFSVAMRTSVKKTGPATGLLPLTVLEVRRLLVHLRWTRRPEAVHVLGWSRWRRRHQWRAKQCHYRRRGAVCLLELRL
jgi:SRSO17 transposase